MNLNYIVYQGWNIFYIYTIFIRVYIDIVYVYFVM